MRLIYCFIVFALTHSCRVTTSSHASPLVEGQAPITGFVSRGSPVSLGKREVVQKVFSPFVSRAPFYLTTWHKVIYCNLDRILQYQKSVLWNSSAEMEISHPYSCRVCRMIFATFAIRLFLGECQNTEVVNSANAKIIQCYIIQSSSD